MKIRTNVAPKRRMVTISLEAPFTVVMSLLGIPAIFLLCFGILTTSDESMKLANIISDFLHKYSHNGQSLVSIILHPSSKDQNHFLNDLFLRLFQKSEIKLFVHTILRKLEDTNGYGTETLNLIFVQDIELLP